MSIHTPENPELDELDIAVRAYAEPEVRPARKARQSRSQPSVWTLVFDTETTTDSIQRLRFGTYQVYEREHLKFQGIFYVPDDPKALSKADVAVIKAYAKRSNLELRTVTDFVDNVFYMVGYHWRAAIVGFNLPFDISRLAVGFDKARAVTYPSDGGAGKVTNRSMVGGFTFRLSNSNRPHVRIRHRSSRDALIQFTSLIRGGRPRRGFFIDVRTISAALLGRPFTLSGLAEELKVPNPKLREDRHGQAITNRYLDYAVRDTLTTWECFRELRARYQSLQLTKTPLHALHTEASVGKAYLRQMGIRPFLEVQPDFPRALMGAAMSAYFGGRSEVRIRRKPVRVLYCDFLSMYPTVSTLMGLWGWVRANGVVWEDAASEVRSLLAGIAPKTLQDPAFWPSLTTLVQVEPQDDIFPVRAQYGVDDRQYRLALNRLTSKPPLWFTLADCIASTLLTGRPPKVLKAWRFAPKGFQPGLVPINIAGNPAYRVDPASEDFYLRLIDLRRNVQSAQKRATGLEADILKNEQIAIKNIANATTYGIFIELNPEASDQKSPGICYGHGEPFPVEIAKYEQPGPYFHPLIAVFTTGAARLMLATAERLALDAGLDWAFCDTDSMALAKPDAMSEAEFLEKAQAVRDWFTPLNPYAEKGPVFKIEDDNYRLIDGKPSKEIEPLYCYAISPKRYALFNIGPDGRPIIRKAVAHGLGHLMPPLPNDPIGKGVPEPAVSLRELDLKAWQYNLWYRILEAVLANPPRKPIIDDLPGFNRPAATRYGASTPHILDWCKGMNGKLPLKDRIKPFNFMLRFYSGLIPSPRQLTNHDTPRKAKPMQLRPIAPFDRDTRAAANRCIDRTTGEIIAREHLSTYAQELGPYHLHPDSKFQNGQYDDSGSTRRRHVFVRAIHNIGKEADSLEVQLEHGVNPDAVLDYGSGHGGERISLAEVRRQLAGVNIQKLALAAGVSRQHLIAVRDGTKVPKRTTAIKIVVGLKRLSAGKSAEQQGLSSLLDHARQLRERLGLRKLAQKLRVDHSTLAQTLDGKRPLSGDLRRKLGNLSLK